MEQRKNGQDLSLGHFHFCWTFFFFKLNCFICFVSQVALSFQKCNPSLHWRIVICIRKGFTKILQTGQNMSGVQNYQQKLLTGDPEWFHGPMDLKMLDLFNVTCTSAMYDVNLTICSYVFSNKNYSLQCMLAVLLLPICSPVRPLKANKSNPLLQAGLTPKLDEVAYGLVQESFENPQGWGFYNTYRQPFPVLNHTYFQLKFFSCNCWLVLSL